MNAAVVHAFDQPPRYADFPDPTPQGNERLVHVRAAALSQITRARAAGKHYSFTHQPPFVPGVDGAGQLDDGRRVYFSFPRAPYGAMAERTVAVDALCVDLPDDVDDVTAAAIANPGMSSWAALVERASFMPGEQVLVNGATGASGRLAIQIARHLGAARVVPTGRTERHLPPLLALGADRAIALDQPREALDAALAEEILGVGVDVVLDYLWGESAERILHACAGHGSARAEPRVRFVQIGALASPTIALPATALRSSRVELLGSGIGSVSMDGLMRSIGALMRAVGPARITTDVTPVPLSEVERAWEADVGGGRVVFTV